MTEIAVIMRFAEVIGNRVATRVIRALQRDTNSMQSGDDTLTNLWDEYCVQAQGEHSVFWWAYLDTARQHISLEVAKLKEHEQYAVWMQTEDYLNYEDEDGNVNCPPSVDAIVDHILNAHVLNQAVNWHNKRIETFLERDDVF